MASVNVASALHAARHAAGGDDEITPASIGAADEATAAAAQGLAEQAETAAQDAVDAAQQATDTAQSHASRHAQGGPDPLTPAAIGAATPDDVATQLSSVTAESIGAATEADLVEVDATAKGHAARHAKGGPDEVTPDSIGAAPADDPRLKDTGWRTITLLNGWVGTGASAAVNPAIRRIGPNVYVRMRNLNGSAATDATFGSIPAGFLPASEDGGIGHVGGQFQVVSITTAGVILANGAQGRAGSSPSHSISWLTKDPWPAILPGSPA